MMLTMAINSRTIDVLTNLPDALEKQGSGDWGNIYLGLFTDYIALIYRMDQSTMIYWLEERTLQYGLTD